MTNEPFYTTDLLLASILKTKGYELIKYEPRKLPFNNFKVVFYFEQTPELIEEVNNFLRTDCFPFKKFYTSIIELKKIIYDIT